MQITYVGIDNYHDESRPSEAACKTATGAACVTASANDFAVQNM